MAKIIRTLDPEFIQELAWVVQQVKRMFPGGLNGDVAGPTQAPDDVIVMTPVGGIAARVGTTCYGETCAAYRVVDSTFGDGEFTLEATGMNYEIYNISNEAVEGSRYVVTSRLKSGHRYVVLESCLAEA